MFKTVHKDGTPITNFCVQSAASECMRIQDDLAARIEALGGTVEFSGIGQMTVIYPESARQEILSIMAEGRV